MFDAGPATLTRTLVALGVLEVVEVDRHGLGKGEQRPPAASISSGRRMVPNGLMWLSGLSETRPRERDRFVAKRPGCGGVRALVDHDANDDGNGAGKQVHEVAAGHGTPQRTRREARVSR